MNESFHLYLNGGQAQLRRRSGWPWRGQVQELAQWEWDVSDPATLKLPPVLARSRWKRHLHVYAGSALCKFMVAELPAQLRDNDEAGAVTRARMQHQLGLAVSDWSFAVDYASTAGVPIGCAVRRRIFEQVHAMARQYELRLASFKPLVAGIWNAVGQASPRDSECLLIAVERDAFAVVVKRAGRPVSMSALLHGGEPDLIDREMRRLGYSFGAESQEHVRVALAKGLPMASPAHANRIVKREDYLRETLYADFRDLLFPAAERDAQ